MVYSIMNWIYALIHVQISNLTQGVALVRKQNKTKQIKTKTKTKQKKKHAGDFKCTMPPAL